jgi:hypothetical protein
MAWNPSPEVAVARDAATRLSEITKTKVLHSIVIFTTADGKLGYASYGIDSKHCAFAKRMADAAYKAVLEWFAED